MTVIKKHAIITGGSSGIGKALAIKLAHQDYHISIIARDQTKLNQAVDEITQHRHTKEQQFSALAIDVSNETSVRQAIDQAVLTHGAPDLLITSAGIAHPDYFENLTTEIFEKSIAINYLGTLYAIKATFPYMKQNKTGHIVMISSGAGLIGLFGYSAYSPSKFAVRGLAESLRPEFKKLGIKVSIVYPPDTDTPQLIQENQTKPIETKQITGTINPWSADNVADCILKGISKNQFHITPGLPTRLLRLFHSPIFNILNFYFDKLIKTKNTSISKVVKE